MPEQKEGSPERETPPAPASAVTEAPAPSAAPAKAAAPATPAPTAAPAKAAAPAAPPKPAPPSLTPLEMIGPDLKAYLERMLASGDQVTFHWKGGDFTGRIFRMMLHEGWIALEHVDGRRRSCWVIQGGKVTDAAGHEHALPGAASH